METNTRSPRSGGGYVEAIPQKIVLIDGVKLAAFMIDHNVGVAPAKSYILKRLDQDYFESL
jgi:restriction system protein